MIIVTVNVLTLEPPSSKRNELYCSYSSLCIDLFDYFSEKNNEHRVVFIYSDAFIHMVREAVSRRHLKSLPSVFLLR